MAALGDVSRQLAPPPALIALTIPGALGMGDNDFSREVPPKGGDGGGGGGGPVLPTFGQIFPSGR